MLPIERSNGPATASEQVPRMQRWLWFLALYLPGVATLFAGSWRLKDLLIMVLR